MEIPIYWVELVVPKEEWNHHVHACLSGSVGNG